MNNTLQHVVHISGCSKPGYGVRENGVAISVVRNVVVNMESVLTDLKGIMGEITTIVDHIDTVTGRFDKHYKTGKDNRGAHASNLGKSLCGNYSDSMIVKTDTLLTPESDKQFPAEPSQIANISPSHKVLKVTGFNVQKNFPSPNQHSKYGDINMDGGARLEWHNSSKMLSISKECNLLANKGTGVMPQNGAIAIVYPTIIKSVPAISNKTNTETLSTQNLFASINNFPATSSKRGTDMSNTQKSVISTDNNSHTEMSIARTSLEKIPKSKNYFTSSSEAVNPETSNQDIENTESKLEKVETKCEIKFDRHTSSHILPVTQADQKPSFTGPKEKHSNSQFSRQTSIIMESLPENWETPTVIESMGLDIKYSRDMKTKLNNSINFPNHQSIVSTGEVDFLKKSSEPCQNQDLMFKSPRMRNSSPKSVYSKVHSSPASVRSLKTNRDWENKNYYYSTESDADSDSCVEYHDIRSITPDIDWSYLNLVGSGNTHNNLTMVADTRSHIRAIRTGELCKPHNVYSLLNSAHVEHISGDIDAASLLEAKEKFNKTPTVLLHRYSITGSLVPIHIFCNEVGSFESVGYCGYYEAILDSVLENIAGFESFEEACDAIENIGALNEAYASCDTEFEEDDWDIGIKSVDHEYELPSSDVHQHACLDLECLEFLDRNQNVLSANSRNPNQKSEREHVDRNITTDLTGALVAIDKALYEKRNKQTSPIAADYENQDSFTLLTMGNSLTNDDNGAIKIESSNLNQNVVLRPESIHSMEVHLGNEQVINTTTINLETDRSLTDVASCTTYGSPMSFSSSEITYTSPETDLVESTSEEDLNSSQDDSASLSSEIGYDAKLCVHKAKIKRLRREFFLSLYKKFDEKEAETSNHNYSVTSLDEIVSQGQSLSRLDNNRDNISESGSYLDNVTGYNKSINTWTEYALVDLQTDDMSDTASDIFNEYNIN